MKKSIILKKQDDPGKFAVSCLLQVIKFPGALCDTGSLVSILPKVLADPLDLKVEPSHESFTFVDCSIRSSIARDLQVQIVNALIRVDFHVLENKMNKNSSLLLGKNVLSYRRSCL